MKRRDLLFASLGVAAFADNKRIRVGCDTKAWKIEVPEFHNLVRILPEVKEAGYEGFETGYRNVQGQFENLKEARAKLTATGIPFYGCYIFQHEYDPKTNIPAFSLIQRIALGVEKLGCERLIVSGSAVGNDQERLRWKAGALSRAGRLCRDLKLERICYRCSAEDMVEVTALLKETDPDTVRFVLDEASDVQFFAKHYKRIDSIRVSIAKDHAELAAVVAKTNWQGWVIAEEAEGEKVTMTKARQAIRTGFHT